MTTLYTAKKYAVPALEAHCVEFLKKNLRADNAFMLLTQVRDGGGGGGGRGGGVQVCRCGARPQGAGRGRGTRWGAGAPGVRKDAGAWVPVRMPGQGRTDGGISEFRRRLTCARVSVSLTSSCPCPCPWWHRGVSLVASRAVHLVGRPASQQSFTEGFPLAFWCPCAELRCGGKGVPY